MLERGFEFAPGYRLQEFLGRGQFGQVWRATAPGGAAAAVKFIDLTEGSGQKEYDGVKRVKQIRQANLMPITAIWLLDKHGKILDEPPDDATQTMDVSTAGTSQSGMVVMPQDEPAWLVVAMLLGGQSLLQRLRECKQEGHQGIPPRELLSYMDESAKGLDFLNEPRHDLGEGPVAIQHCDVKPANIVMIGTSAVVCDFGLARILSRNQITATSASGTPAYMAPEAIAGKPSRTSDQYSLAVTYYHLRTGTLPTKEGTLFEVLDAHRQGNLDFSEVDGPERGVLKKATDLDWEQRFDSNADFVEALREALRREGHTHTKFAVEPDAENDSLSRPGNHAFETVAKLDPGYPQPHTNDVETVDLGADQSAESLSTSVPVWLQRKYFVPAAVVCVLAIIGLISFYPDGSHGRNDNPREADPVGKLSAGELLVAAKQQFAAADESQALELFSEALGKDPSLSQVASQLVGAHSSAVEKLLLTPDGSFLATLGYDKAPYLWKMDTLREGAQQQKLQAGNASIYPDALTMSPDGRQLLCGIDAIPYVWTIHSDATAETRLALPEHEDEILAVAWHPTDKQFLVTASGDGKISVVQLGSPTVDSPQGSVAKSKFFDSITIPRVLRFDPAGRYLVAIDEQDGVRAIEWDELVKRMDDASAPAAEVVNAAGTRAVCLGFVTRSADVEPVVAVGSLDGAITLWQLGTIQQQDRYAPHDGSSVETISLAHNTTGDVIATGGADGKISVWPLVANPAGRKTYAISPQAVADIDISADGRWIAAVCNDGGVWLWDHQADKAAQIFADVGTVDSVRIDSAGGWLLAGCGDGTIRAWDLLHCKLVTLSTTLVDVQLRPKQPAAQTQVSL